MPRYEPDVGLTRLETVRVSRAAADQRRGRAGRTEPGVCYRLWDEPQTASLEPYARPEILAADLSGLLLDLAQWGAADPGTLAFLDPPPAGALAEARALLTELGAIDARRPHHRRGPQAARAAAAAAACAHGGRRRRGRARAQRAADIAAILSERGLGGDDVDLAHRLDQFRRDRSRRGEDARRMAKRWAEDAVRVEAARADLSPGAILSLAYPDRIAKSRGAGGAFLLANGRGANVDPASALAREPFLAVAELAGTAAQGRILLAASITLEEIEQRFADRIESREDIIVRRRVRQLARPPQRAARRARAGRADNARRRPAEANARLLAEGIARLGVDRLPWTKSLQAMARPRDVPAPRRRRRMAGPVRRGARRQRREWLVPLLGGKTALSDISGRRAFGRGRRRCCPGI